MNRLTIHPENPQQRVLKHVYEDVLLSGGLVVTPTAVGYVWVGRLGHRVAMKSIQSLVKKRETFACLVCRDVSMMSGYATLDQLVFKHVKAHADVVGQGYVLPARRSVPRDLQHRHHVRLALAQSPVLKTWLSWSDESWVIVPCFEDENIHSVEEVNAWAAGGVEVALCTGELVSKTMMWYES